MVSREQKDKGVEEEAGNLTKREGGSWKQGSANTLDGQLKHPFWGNLCAKGLHAPLSVQRVCECQWQVVAQEKIGRLVEMDQQ